MDKSAAATAVVVATAAAVIGRTETAATAANKYEDQDKDPGAAVSAKAIVTHSKDLLFLSSSHTMP